MGKRKGTHTGAGKGEKEKRKMKKMKKKKNNAKKKEEGEREVHSCGAAALPEDVLYHIFAHLAPADIAACARVCSSWNAVCTSDHVWERVLRTHSKYTRMRERAEDTSLFHAVESELEDTAHGSKPHTHTARVLFAMDAHIARALDGVATAMRRDEESTRVMETREAAAAAKREETQRVLRAWEDTEGVRLPVELVAVLERFGPKFGPTKPYNAWDYWVLGVDGLVAPRDGSTVPSLYERGEFDGIGGSWEDAVRERATSWYRERHGVEPSEEWLESSDEAANVRDEVADTSSQGTLIISDDAMLSYYVLVVSGKRRGEVWSLSEGDVLPAHAHLLEYLQARVPK